MPDSRSPHLLSNFPIISTDDREQFVAALRKAHNVKRLSFKNMEERFHSIMNRVRLNGVTLHYSYRNTAMDVFYSDMPGFRQPLVMSGAGYVKLGRLMTEHSRSAASIVPPESDYEVGYGGGGYAQLLLEFEPQLLVRHLELLTGRSAPSEIAVASRGPLDAERLLRLRAIAIALSMQLQGQGSLQSAVVIELEQALRSSFIVENQIFPTRAESAKPASDLIIKRLEEYMHAHSSEGLTVETIARECRVSVRSVYVRFSQRHGCSPMTYLRAVRLERARELLLSNKEDVSVIGVALRCGFASFGHFAERYKSKFGELPSATLSRRR